MERRRRPIENFRSAIRTTISTLRATLSRVTVSFLPLLPLVCRLIATLLRQQYSRWSLTCLVVGGLVHFTKENLLFLSFPSFNFQKFPSNSFLQPWPRFHDFSTTLSPRAFSMMSSSQTHSGNIDFLKIPHRQSNPSTPFSSLSSFRVAKPPFSLPEYTRELSNFIKGRGIRISFRPSPYPRQWALLC